MLGKKTFVTVITTIMTERFFFLVPRAHYYDVSYRNRDATIHILINNMDKKKHLYETCPSPRRVLGRYRHSSTIIIIIMTITTMCVIIILI